MALDQEQLRQAYRDMSFIRAFEKRLNELFLQGIVAGTTHLCVGQEACAVGTCMALTGDDCVFSNHRGHGHLLARGAEPSRVMAEIFGSPLGYAGGRGGSQHMAIKEIGFLGTHGITAGTIPIAAGAALHKKIQNEPGVAVVFFGDGAVGEGAFHESLNMAQIWKLPVLFVCENNLYAMSTPHAKASPVTDITKRALAYDMRSELVDGNDVEAVFAATKAARDAAVAGEGPTLLELKTYRQLGHSRGDPRAYRTRDEEDEWSQRDPLDIARSRLDDWPESREDQLQVEIAEGLAAAEELAKQKQTSLKNA